jgi:two-component system cell cycle sensor histidine kinase/response regulator CckA
MPNDEGPLGKRNTPEQQSIQSRNPSLESAERRSKKTSHFRILFLEDFPDFVELALHALTTAGFSVEWDIVQEPKDFVSKLHYKAYDLILADYRLPNWTGRDALKVRNERWPEIPFIFLTGTQGDEIAADCMRDGATEYLLKKQISRLPHTVRRAIEQHRKIREHERAEEALRYSEERYRSLFENNPLPTWIFDASSLRFLAVNQSAVELYGYSRAEFLRMTMRDIWLPADIPALVESVANKTHHAGIWKHRKKNGKVIFAEITENVLKVDGEETRIVVSNDVTERINAEAAIEATAAEYRSIVEGAPYGIYRTREDATIVCANAALVHMLGYDSPADLIGSKTTELFYSDPAERENLRALWRDSKRPTPVELDWRRKDGKEIAVRLVGRALPIASDGQEIYEFFVEDITGQRVLELNLRHAQKMEAVGRLAGGIVHDFNNLLMIIGGYSKLISSEGTDIGKIQSYSQQISDAVARANAVTRHLLAFCRKQVLQPSVLDPNLLIQSLSKMLRYPLGEDVELIVRTTATGRIKADTTQVEQVIMNLALNARDAMPNGGQLIIETADVALDAPFIKLRSLELPTGEYVMFSVADTGSGMSSEVKARIFEPFFTTKDPDNGTGLGLATVFGIVKQSGGDITVESAPGCGSTFRIYLPAVSQTPKRQSSAA